MEIEIKGETKEEKKVFELKRKSRGCIVLYCNDEDIAYFHDDGQANFYLNDLKKEGFNVNLLGQTGE